MDQKFSPARRHFPGSRLARSLLVFALAGFVVTPVAADTFFVTDTTDAIPPPLGTLRSAIELSELNGKADFVEFLIDGGTIELVAPLPDLQEGKLSIGFPRQTGQPAVGNGITISGVNGVERAIRVRSAENVIGGLDFAEFSGAEVILIEGNQADTNLITNCVFGSDNASGLNAGVAVRIVTGATTANDRAPNEIRLSRFVRNGLAVSIEGDGSGVAPRVGAFIHDNWFGTSPFGGPGPGNGEAIHATAGGRIHINDNRFSGPGEGITLGPGSDGSVVDGNEIGLDDSSSICSGFDGPAIRVEDAVGVQIRSNAILCSDVGVYLGIGAMRTFVGDNSIGGRAPAGHLSHGIVIDSASETLIRHNAISGNDGYAIAEAPGPVIDPSSVLIACNSIFDNTAGALWLPSVTTMPPVLMSATAIRVNGNVPDITPGWVEVFGDSAGQARVFQGTTTIQNDIVPFSHLISVLGLTLSEVQTGTELGFDRSIPTNHTSTRSMQATRTTTELSNDVPAAPDVVYDVIRGGLENLAFGATGGIDLGPVICLGSGVDPDITVTPNIVDPDIPHQGRGFFYLVRRSDPLQNAPGTYDPAICLTEADDFNGPRRASSGDCP
jgi:hypothetical protein